MSKRAALRRGRSLGAKISGGRGRPREHFLVSRKLDTFCYLTVEMHRATCRRSDTIPACDRQTDRQTDRRTDGRTDGIAVASTVLAKRALRCAVKTGNINGQYRVRVLVCTFTNFVQIL